MVGLGGRGTSTLGTLEGSARLQARIGEYPMFTPVRRELKTNRTYGLSVNEFYFLKPPHWGDNRVCS